MSIRNLDALFDPKVIAVVGASNRPHSVGAVLAQNMAAGGFTGTLLAVNPRLDSGLPMPSYRSVADLPVAPDLAVLATPPATVASLIAELGAKGCRAAVVLTAGFGEGESATGAELRAAMLAAARPHLLRIVGPNCLGFVSPAKHVNASFAHVFPPPGEIAVVAQSGAVAAAVMDWAAARGIGLSHVISVGDMADVDFGDLLDMLALDHHTRAILLYVEAIVHARKFMSAARIAARIKPVIVVKAGRSAAGAHAALSHTGALAGSDIVYDAAFRRAGLLRVTELRELFDAVAMLSSGIRVAGDRLAILTNGGGLGVLAADAIDLAQGKLAPLPPATIEALNAVLPSTWSHRNPVDIIGDATGERYVRALRVLVKNPECDAVLVMNVPTAVSDSLGAAQAVAAAIPTDPPVPLLSCWVGDGPASEARAVLARKKVPAFETPDDAVRGFMQLVNYRRNQEALLETPPAAPALGLPRRQEAAAVIGGALTEKRTLLSAPEAKGLLAAYGIPVAESRVAADAVEAGRIAETLGGAVAVKILSPDLTHKSDVGGVRLDLRGGEAAASAAREMQATVRARAPKARLAGFTVERMVRPSDGPELLLGIASDPTFGPVILFGSGGTAAEAIGDRAVGLPPLNLALARSLVRETRVSRLLSGYRGRPPAIDAVAAVLVQLSQMVVDFAEIVELDINPLIVDGTDVMALDARAVIAAADGAKPADRLAIRPYPSELEHDAALPDGSHVLVRPIRPQDEAALIEMLRSCSLDDIRLRFFRPIRDFPHELAARFSQIDYGREMAFVAVRADAARPELLGVSRLVGDPDNERAEYAILVRSDQQGRGLGYLLMTELVRYARARATGRIVGEILRENTVMLQMVRELGFAITGAEDPTTVSVSLDLRPAAS